MLDEAGRIMEILPAAELGKCIISRNGTLFRGNCDQLASARRDDTLVFHEGRIGGSWPAVRAVD